MFGIEFGKNRYKDLWFLWDSEIFEKSNCRIKTFDVNSLQLGNL